MANKTKYLIVDSFLSLVENKRVDKISVTDLVDKCDISRQTFYYHFDSIDEMLKWAIREETQKICSNNIGSQKWVIACAEYIPFLKKYNNLFKSCIDTSYASFIYNLIAESTYEFSCQYFIKSNNKSVIPANTLFILKCTSLSFCGLIIEEFQKSDTDYDSLMKKIEKAFEKDA